MSEEQEERIMDNISGSIWGAKPPERTEIVRAKDKKEKKTKKEKDGNK